MKSIDLNADLGEGFAFDDELLRFVTSANVCCGEHAGDEALTFATVEKCLSAGVRVGAHPGFPDRASMGRAGIPDGMEKAYLESIHQQIQRFVNHFPAAYLKPHGAYYNSLSMPWDPGAATPFRYPTAQTAYEAGGLALSQVPGSGVLLLCLRIYKLPLMGMVGTMHEEIARRAGQPLIREGFADRRYLPNGTLMPRSEESAMIDDPEEALEQVLSLAPHIDSICIHGDTKEAVMFAETIHRGLSDAGYTISA